MTELEPYLKSLFFMSQSEIPVPPGYHRKQEILPVFAEKIEAIIQNYNAIDLVDTESVAEIIFTTLLTDKVIRVDEQKFAGKYYIFVRESYPAFRGTFVANDNIAVTAERIGKRFFPDVIEGIRSANIEVPAADRIVSLDHNDPKLVEIKKEFESLETQLKAGNDVGELDESDVAAAIAEVADLRRILEQLAVRWDDIRTRSINTLSWIGTQAAAAIVGAMALGILALLASFFGFQF